MFTKYYTDAVKIFGLNYVSETIPTRSDSDLRPRCSGAILKGNCMCPVRLRRFNWINLHYSESALRILTLDASFCVLGPKHLV